MRVALESNGIYTTQAGVARYIRGLMRGFEQASIQGLELEPVAWPVMNLSYRQPWRALKTAYRELFWCKRVAPGILRKGGFDLFHSTSFGLVDPPCSVPEVATLYDLALLRNPERFRPWQLQSGKRRYSHLRKVKKILSISRFSADEAVELLGLDPGKFEVVHLGCDFIESESASPLCRLDFEVPSEYFLFVGSLEPGKNLNLLKKTYLFAESQGCMLPPLLVVGARWEGVENEGEHPKEWHYLGRQPDAVLHLLYRRALALVFPSKYEGFGLPVVEAMSVGCPVICSPVASLPEVAGDAAIMSEQTPQGYRDAMIRLARSGSLRDDVIRRGLEQAAKFTWKRCALETADVYKAALSK